jgi:hypothetical protein
MIIKYSTGKVSTVYNDDETEAKEKTEKEANVPEKDETAVKEDKEEGE